MWSILDHELENEWKSFDSKRHFVAQKTYVFFCCKIDKIFCVVNIWNWSSKLIWRCNNLNHAKNSTNGCTFCTFFWKYVTLLFLQWDRTTREPGKHSTFIWVSNNWFFFILRLNVLNRTQVSSNALKWHWLMSCKTSST